LVRTDSRFFGLVFPQTVRQILQHILVVEGIDDLDAANNWQRDWLTWAIRSHPDGSGVPEGDDEDARRIKLAWADTIANSFARTHRTRELFERSLEVGAAM
jgi:hypothetical protein